MMEEVLSNTLDQNLPLREQEYFSLSLLEEVNPLGTRYRIQQAHAGWSETDGRIMFDHEETEYFWMLGEAKRRYMRSAGQHWAKRDSSTQIWTCFDSGSQSFSNPLPHGLQVPF
jgi:hypothetical protein